MVRAKRLTKIWILIYFELFHFANRIYSEKIDYANPDGAFLNIDFEFEYTDLNYDTFNQEHDHILQYYKKLHNKNYGEKHIELLPSKKFNNVKNNEKDNKIYWKSLYMNKKLINLFKRKRASRIKRGLKGNDLIAMNNKLMNQIKSVRSWLTYEVDGKMPQPRMIYSRLIKHFEIYYECMKKRMEFFKETLSRPMANIISFNIVSDEKVTIECKTCGSDYGLRWYRRLLQKGGGYTEIPNDPSQFSVSFEGDLTIHLLKPEDAGMYTCFVGKTHETTYLIGVEDLEARVRVYESADVAAITKPEVLTSLNLYVFYQWSQWSECNRCSGKGVKKRIGSCMLKVYDSKQPTKPYNSEVLHKYPNGLPCISPFIPTSLYQAANLRSRRSEMMVEPCQKTCPTRPPIKRITDKDGNVIDVVDVYKGRRSVYEGVPVPNEAPKRTAIHGVLGGRVVVKCPNENSTRIPLSWRNGTLAIDENKIVYATNFRVVVNDRNELVIKKLIKADEGFYSCWVHVRHMGTVYLFVINSVNWILIFTDLFSRFGSVLCLLSFIYIVLRLAVLRCRVPKQFK